MHKNLKNINEEVGRMNELMGLINEKKENKKEKGLGDKLTKSIGKEVKKYLTDPEAAEKAFSAIKDLGSSFLNTTSDTPKSSTSNLNVDTSKLSTWVNLTQQLINLSSQYNRQDLVNVLQDTLSGVEKSGAPKIKEKDKRAGVGAEITPKTAPAPTVIRWSSKNKNMRGIISKWKNDGTAQIIYADKNKINKISSNPSKLNKVKILTPPKDASDPLYSQWKQIKSGSVKSVKDKDSNFQKLGGEMVTIDGKKYEIGEEYWFKNKQRTKGKGGQGDLMAYDDKTKTMTVDYNGRKMSMPLSKWEISEVSQILRRLSQIIVENYY